MKSNTLSKNMVATNAELSTTVHTTFSQVTPPTEMLRKRPKNTKKAETSTDPASGADMFRSKQETQCTSEKILSVSEPKMHLAAIHELSKMELRCQYAAEANAHRNMLCRGQSKGAVIHPEFRDFGSFLSHVGPIPAKGATLDRIDNHDPEYAPGKVRWADKRTQNGNKGDTLVFHYSRTGDSYTVSRLAKLQKVTSNTIRMRLHRGWTDDEIIDGKRAAPSVVPSPVASKNPPAQSRKTMLVQPLSSMAQIQFERNAIYCRLVRETDGEEYFLATPKEVGQIIPDFFDPARVRRAWPKFMKLTLPQWWREHKAHIRFDDLKPFQKRLIRQIDPIMRQTAKSK